MNVASTVILAALLVSACTPSQHAAIVHAPTAGLVDRAPPIARDRMQVLQLSGEVRTTSVRQIPSDTITIGKASPEIDLAPRVQRTAETSAVYRDVVTAWQAIRARGQQPSAELLAQAVGPETLAAFLTLFPDQAGLLRGNTDASPPAVPSDTSPTPAPRDSKP